MIGTQNPQTKNDVHIIIINQVMEQKLSKTGMHEKNEESAYQEKYQKIHTVIEDLNSKLMNMFQKKEKQLIDQYKNKMFEVQHQLNQLRQNTNQQELRRKFIEKKEELQKERQQFLQASIFFSNKCEAFKHKLAKVVNETKDLQNQIKFLNQQINNANRKNIKLKQELNSINDPNSQTEKKQIRIETPKKKNTNSTIKTKAQDSLRKNQTSIKKEPLNQSVGKVKTEMRRNQSYNAEIKKIKDKNQKLKEILQNPIFKQNDFERMFMESVEKIKQKKKEKIRSQKKNDKLLPSLKKSNNQQEKQIKISDGQLNDFDKRHIMEDFLSKQSVKKYLYQIIFKDVPQLQKQKQHKGEIFEKNFI